MIVALRRFDHGRINDIKVYCIVIIMSQISLVTYYVRICGKLHSSI